MSLGTSVNMKKNGILLAYIAKNIPNIHLRKLLKIVYLIDEHFMKMRGFPLTWFDYYAWAKGPVAPEVYDLKNGAFSEFVASHHDGNGKRIVNAIGSHHISLNFDEWGFSDNEVRQIDGLIDLFRDKSADELSDLTHEPDSIWSRIVSQNKIEFDEDHGTSDCEIPLTMLFSDNDDRIAEYRRAKAAMKLQEALRKMRNPNHKIQFVAVTPSEREQYGHPAYKPIIP